MSDAPLTQPDPSTVIHGQCPICKKVVYKPEEVGVRCPYTYKERRCLGIIEGSTDDPDRVNINGSKVIEFSKAVRELANLFDSMNIVGLKELFLMGRKAENVEMVIEQKRIWHDAIKEITIELKERLVFVEKAREGTKEAMLMLDAAHKLVLSAEHRKVEQHVESFVSLLDRLEAHRKSGLLDVITAISKEPK